MFRVIRHPLTLSILAVAGTYVLFAYIIDPPIPRSLIVLFMIVVVIGVLMVATFDDTGYARLLAPLQALFGSPALRRWRLLVTAVAAIGITGFTYRELTPDLEAPIELRTVHPAPPSNLRLFDRSIDLVALENPFRAEAPEGSEAYEELIAEGADLYFQNCIYCHGDLLDGRGQFAAAFNPRPANFQDVGTIAQLQESYLFWRIATGGPGLPREAAPWASSMPVWHEMLDEDEIWKIVMFLYDYTGHEPRSWELEEGAAPAASEVPEAADADDGEDADADEGHVEQVYQRRCAACHGIEGLGDGPAADFLYPRPRDFELGLFKFKTTHADDEFPSDDDFRKTIRDGLPGTSMPGWSEVVSDAEIDGLIQLIKQFGYWDEEEIELRPIEMGTPVPVSEESLTRGATLYKKACEECHGAKGRGNVISGKKLRDDWGERIWPRNLTRPETWRWTATAAEVYHRLSAGIRGTPMPEHTTTLSEQDRWDIANYAMTLHEHAVPVVAGETVLRGHRIDGPMPDDPEDPAWTAAPPLTLPLAPNMIKEPRLFYSLVETVTARVLFSSDTIAIRLAFDDPTYSVPGHEEEIRYAHEDIEATSDAVAVQLPLTIPQTSERPWFRHGDRDHPVNIWYWRAPSVEPEFPETVLVFDAAGPDQPPRPRQIADPVGARGQWQDGQWQVVFTRPLQTDSVTDLQIETGRYIPIAFANWDGWAGHTGGRHVLTTWYWLLLPADQSPATVIGGALASGLVTVLALLGIARVQRRRYIDDRQS